MRTGLTHDICRLSAMPASDIPNKSREIARLSLLDWAACTIAGASEPLAMRLGAFLDQEAGHSGGLRRWREASSRACCGFAEWRGLACA